MRNEPLDLSTVSLSLPRDLVLASAVQLLESHKMHSKWNLLQNLTRTIRQAGAALRRSRRRSFGQTWMDGGRVVSVVSAAAAAAAKPAEACCTPQVAA